MLASFPEAAYKAESVTQNLFGAKRLLLAKPSAIRHVLLDNSGNYRRPPASYRTLQPMLGDGLIISEGEVWRRHRHILAPLFAPRVIPLLGEIILDSALRWVKRVAERADEPVDLLQEMRHLALEIAARTMFSVDPGDEGRTLRRYLERFTDRLGHPRTLDFLLPLWLPSPHDIPRRRFHADMMRVMERFMDRRLNHPPDQRARDLIEAMVAARDPESGAGLSRQEILDEVNTMLIAGHETTSLGLFWAFCVLAHAPREQERLAEEAAAANLLPEHSEQLLAELVYARATASESLRLYPPVAVMNRLAQADDCADGIEIPRGTHVVIAPWILHHHSRFWQDPYTFDPSRFLPEAPQPSRFVYLPFGAGRRICIGAAFAMAELMLVLASMLKNFRVEPAEQRMPRPVSVIVTRPDRSIRFRLIPR
ncbi:MAG: cytochrome P450 [Acetobacteraceae bacterium]